MSDSIGVPLPSYHVNVQASAWLQSWSFARLPQSMTLLPSFLSAATEVCALIRRGRVCLILDAAVVDVVRPFALRVPDRRHDCVAVEPRSRRPDPPLPRLLPVDAADRCRRGAVALHFRRVLIGHEVGGVDGVQERAGGPIERDSEDTVVGIAVKEGEPAAVPAVEGAEREPGGQHSAESSTTARDSERQLPALRRRETQAAGTRGAGRALCQACGTARPRKRGDQDHDQDQAASRHSTLRAGVQERRGRGYPFNRE